MSSRSPWPNSDERPPLTVNKRSFLDPGPVVPVGTMHNYVTANTIFNRTPDQTARDQNMAMKSSPGRSKFRAAHRRSMNSRLAACSTSPTRAGGRKDG